MGIMMTMMMKEEERKDKEKGRSNACMHEWVEWNLQHFPLQEVLISLAFHWPGILGHKKKKCSLLASTLSLGLQAHSCRLEAEGEVCTGSQLVPECPLTSDPRWATPSISCPLPPSTLLSLQFESLSGHSLSAKKHAQAFSQPLPLSVLLSPPPLPCC